MWTLAGVGERASLASSYTNGGYQYSQGGSSSIYDEINSILMTPDHDPVTVPCRTVVDLHSNGGVNRVVNLSPHAMTLKHAETLPTHDDYGFSNQLYPPSNESYT